MNFFHLLVLLEKGNKTLFDCPVEEQKAYLASLGKPGDLYDRSYKQYRCQMYMVPLWKRIFLSFSSALIFPFLLVYLLLRGLKYGHERDIPAVSDFTTLAEVIPEELLAEWAPDSSVWDNATGLKMNDLGFISRLFFQFILHPYLVLKLTMKIALYRLLIVRYSPKAIVVHNEYSFTSSVLTSLSIFGEETVKGSAISSAAQSRISRIRTGVFIVILPPISQIRKFCCIYHTTEFPFHVFFSCFAAAWNERTKNDTKCDEQ